MIEVRKITIAIHVLSTFASTTLAALSSSLWLRETPQSPQPYIIPKLASTSLLAGPNVVYRFPVTGNSSGGGIHPPNHRLARSPQFWRLPPHPSNPPRELLLLQRALCALGGYEREDYDGGRLWCSAAEYDSYVQLIDPDTMLTGVIAPGGFEKLFFFMGEPYESSSDSPSPPLTNADGSVVDKDPPPPHPVDRLEGFDVYASPSYTPRTDFENGTAPATAPWHNAPNAIPRLHISSQRTGDQSF